MDIWVISSWAGIKQLWTLGYKSLRFHFSTRQVSGRYFASSWTSFPGRVLTGAKIITHSQFGLLIWQLSLSWDVLSTNEHVHKKSKWKGIKRHRSNFHSSPSALQVPSSDDTNLMSSNGEMTPYQFLCNLKMSSAHKAHIGSSFSPFMYGAFVLFFKNTYLAGPDLSCGSEISNIHCSTWDL